MRVKELYVYPIKSLRGISSTTLKASSLGFEHDRHFMLQKVSDGKTMHVSHFPSMCLFTTELSPSPSPSKIIVRYAKDHVFDCPEQKLSPQNETLEIPLRPDCTNLSPVSVNMHSSSTSGFDMGGIYNGWFGERLGFEVRLLFLGENRRQALGNVTPNAVAAFVGDPNPKQYYETKNSKTSGSWFGGFSTTLASAAQTVASYAGVSASGGPLEEAISFADCAPFLIVSDKSWQNVQRRLPDEEFLDISKFRPNIVVEGADEEFEEDFWAELAIGGAGGADVVLTQNCVRCNSLNVDYETGKVGAGEAGKVLKKLQKDRRVDPGAKYSPVFGRYGFLSGKPSAVSGSGGSRTGEGTPKVLVSVGDQVEVTKRNDRRTHFYWPGLST